jgi:hypothetical protein
MIDFEKAKNWSEERLMFEINEISEEIRKLENKVSERRQYNKEAAIRYDEIKEEMYNRGSNNIYSGYEEDLGAWMSVIRGHNDEIFKLTNEVKLKNDVKEKLKSILRSK